MSEIEVPLEKVSEDIHHAAHQSDPSMATFINRSALLSAFLAAFAAVSALFAGHDANEAMIEQIRSSDQWNYYQAKGIKSSIAELRASMTQDPTEKSKQLAKVEQYKTEQAAIKTGADEKEKRSVALLLRHESLAASVTFFQIAIALTAIAVLSKKTLFLGVALLTGASGAAWMLKSFLS